VKPADDYNPNDAPYDYMNDFNICETPHSLSINPLTNMIYVACLYADPQHGAVLALNLTTGSITTLVLGSQCFNALYTAIDLYTNILYVACFGSDTILAVDTISGNVSTATTACGGPRAVSVNPNGIGVIYFGCWNSNTLMSLQVSNASAVPQVVNGNCAMPTEARVMCQPGSTTSYTQYCFPCFNPPHSTCSSGFNGNGTWACNSGYTKVGSTCVGPVYSSSTGLNAVSSTGVNAQSSTGTNVQSSTATNAVSSTATNAVSSTATNAQSSTATNAVSSTATNAPSSTATSAVSSTATDAQSSTATNAVSSTGTDAQSSTGTPLQSSTAANSRSSSTAASIAQISSTAPNAHLSSTSTPSSTAGQSTHNTSYSSSTASIRGNSSSSTGASNTTTTTYSSSSSSGAGSVLDVQSDSSSDPPWWQTTGYIAILAGGGLVLSIGIILGAWACKSKGYKKLVQG
jgi:hypothetical protein